MDNTISASSLNFDQKIDDWNIISCIYALELLVFLFLPPFSLSFCVKEKRTPEWLNAIWVERKRITVFWRYRNCPSKWVLWSTRRGNQVQQEKKPLHPLFVLTAFYFVVKDFISSSFFRVQTPKSVFYRHRWFTKTRNSSEKRWNRVKDEPEVEDTRTPHTWVLQLHVCKTWRSWGRKGGKKWKKDIEQQWYPERKEEWE